LLPAGGIEIGIAGILNVRAGAGRVGHLKETIPMTMILLFAA
jgi:hypothetical protein